MHGRRKQSIDLTVIFALNVVLIVLFQLFLPVSAAYKQYDRGNGVVEIQKKLSQWGYYSGETDGIFGEKTRQAVIAFQKKNGLTVDGIVGNQTLAAMGLNSLASPASSGGGSSSDVALLARLISAEARGEPYTGQVAVGAVVLNRTRHPSFPGTISGVIYQNGAFSCLNDGQFYQPVADSAYQAARDALSGWDPTGGAIYYFNPATATSRWIWSRPLQVVIGKHRFCL